MIAECIVAVVGMFILGFIVGFGTMAGLSTMRNNRFYERGYKQCQADEELN